MEKGLQTFLAAAFFFLLLSCTANAQENIQFSQFFLNPYQFNPSFAAHHGHAEANLFYRQQWLGIDNAPKSAAFNVQAPVGRSVSLGLSINSSKTILLTGNSPTASFTYRVRLGHYHHLNFGLSAGVVMTNFDLDAIANAGNDPALANVAQRSMYAVNQFGLNYQYKSFNFGFALPQLLDSRPTSVKEFQGIRFDPFAVKFASVACTFAVTHDIKVSPMVLYRALDAQQHQVEGLVTATYKNVFWVGTSYRHGYGVTAFIGFRAKGIVRVGYAYERPTSRISSAANGSHEFFTGIRLGQRDREEEYWAELSRQDSMARVAKNRKLLPPPEVAQEDADSIAKEKRAAETVIILKDTASISHVEVQPLAVVDNLPARNATAGKGEETFEGYYVVVGAFKVYSHAMNEIRILKLRGQFPKMIHLPDENFWHVYLFHSNEKKDAVRELHDIRKKYPKAWLYAPQP